MFSLQARGSFIILLVSELFLNSVSYMKRGLRLGKSAVNISSFAVFSTCVLVYKDSELLRGTVLRFADYVLLSM